MVSSSGKWRGSTHTQVANLVVIHFGTTIGGSSIFLWFFAFNLFTRRFHYWLSWKVKLATHSFISRLGFWCYSHHFGFLWNINITVWLLAIGGGNFLLLLNNRGNKEIEGKNKKELTLRRTRVWSPADPSSSSSELPFGIGGRGFEGGYASTGGGGNGRFGAWFGVSIKLKITLIDQHSGIIDIPIIPRMELELSDGL